MSVPYYVPILSSFTAISQLLALMTEIRTSIYKTFVNFVVFEAPTKFILKNYFSEEN